MSSDFFYISDNDDNFPIHIAAACSRSAATLEIILKGNEDLCDVRNTNNQTPLDLARACSNTIAAKFLEDNCPPLDHSISDIDATTLCGVNCPQQNHHDEI